MRQFIKSNINNIYIALLSMLTVLVIVIYIQFDNKIDEIRNNIITYGLTETARYAENISNNILSSYGDDFYLKFKDNESLRTEMEEKMALFLTSKYKNVFLIRKDDQGRLRYLLDAAVNVEDRGYFDQKFSPQKNSIWENIFIDSVAKFTIQNNISDLWITFLYPVHVEKKAEAILVFDFSSNEQDELLVILSPLKNFFLYLSIFMIFMLIVSFSQFYIQVWSKNKIIIDPLTLAYNRYYLEELKQKIYLNDYEVCMIDIDHFKKVNDTYGHSAGDEVLRSFSKRIQNQIKDNDILIRYGGEEFLLLLHKLNDKGTCKVPERIRRVIEEGPVGVGSEIIYLTASFGVNNQPHLSLNLNDAIKIADEQLYKAKSSGRNKVIYSHPC